MATPQRLIASLFAMMVGALSVQAQFIWTGAGATGDITLGTNWRGLTAPPNDGTADLIIFDRLHNRLVLPTNYSVHSITMLKDDPMQFSAASPTTLDITGGIILTEDVGSRLIFDSNITLNFAAPIVFDSSGGSINVAGHITGSGPLTLISTSVQQAGFYIFNNTGSGNSYTGGTILGDGINGVGVAFWNGQPFGTGPVTINGNGTFGVQLVAHGAQTLTNAFTYNGNGVMLLRSWDAPLEFSNTFTLNGAVIINAQTTPRFRAGLDLTGSLPLPGMGARNPIVFSGGINETGGSRTLTINGGGIAILNGTNTYTGGTNINGAAIFASNASVPATGTLTVGGGGYLGFGDVSGTNFTTFLTTHFNSAGSNGAVGLDTLPGSSTVTFGGAINLSGFNSGLRLGTATSAILTGTITPQGSTYLFGNGGGILTVTSALTGARNLSLNTNNLNYPLTLILQGANTYTNGTNVANGFLIFDGASALPASGSLFASGASASVGASYIGFTDATGLSAATFLSRFNTANTWGIIGIDTHQGNATTTVSNLNLTAFNDGVFVGTTTSAILNGSLSPTTFVNANNIGSTFRFTAAQNGVLTIDSSITGAFAVVLGSPAASGPYASGTIIMNGANTYSGGTTLNATSPNGLTVALGSSSALGTGNLDIRSQTSGIAGIQATTSGVNLANNINLVNTGTGNTGGPLLHFTGSNNFTLSGNITGDITTALFLFNASPIDVTLDGDNSGFLGRINLFNGTLNLTNNLAAGSGLLSFAGGNTATVAFGGAATAPIVYGIEGDTGTVIIPGGTSVTFDVSGSNDQETSFGGSITGAGGIVVIAPTSTSDQALYLYGNNTYTGGTVVQSNGVLALGHNNAVGTGSVTVNSANGGLVLNSGVTFTNPLIYQTGGLGGFGTFAPSGTTNITFDTGKTVLGGFDGQPGTITFNTNVTFANGGTYAWFLEDVTRPDGMGLVNISGNLLITATSGGFTIKVATFDSNNDLGMALLTPGTAYSLPIATASGGITGFNPSAFSIDSSLFQGGTLSPTVFTLSQSGNTLYLNFTPVPEPSTYALFALGLGVLGLRWRKRS